MIHQVAASFSDATFCQITLVLVVVVIIIIILWNIRRHNADILCGHPHKLVQPYL